jgi:hypothetical protein
VTQQGHGGSQKRAQSMWFLVTCNRSSAALRVHLFLFNVVTHPRGKASTSSSAVAQRATLRAMSPRHLLHNPRHSPGQSSQDPLMPAIDRTVAAGCCERRPMLPTLVNCPASEPASGSGRGGLVAWALRPPPGRVCSGRSPIQARYLAAAPRTSSARSESWPLRAYPADHLYPSQLTKMADEDAIKFLAESTRSARNAPSSSRLSPSLLAQLVASRARSSQLPSRKRNPCTATWTVKTWDAGGV